MLMSFQKTGARGEDTLRIINCEGDYEVMLGIG